MKTKIFIVLFSTMFLSLSLAQNAIELITKKDNTKVYSKDNSSSFSLGRLKQGERVTLLNDEDDWLLVDTPFGTGWVRKKEFSRLANKTPNDNSNHSGNIWFNVPVYPAYPVRPRPPHHRPQKPNRPHHKPDTRPITVPNRLKVSVTVN